MATGAALSPRIQRNAAVIIQLTRTAREIRNAALERASKDLVLALVECAKNVILGSVSLTPAQLTALRRHRKDIETLVKGKTSLRTRKRLLQKGGFLPLLIKPVLGLLGGILGGGGLFGGGRRRR